MSKYYEVQVDMTSKPVASKDSYSLFNQERHTFRTIDEVREFLKQYDGHKRVKCYRDAKDKKHKHTGYIYCFRNRDISHNSEWWLEQDWVEVREIKATTIII